MKRGRRRIDVNLEELDRVLDGAREAPLSEADYDKLKDALHAMAALLVRSPNTEKTSAVTGEAAGGETGDGDGPDASGPRVRPGTGGTAPVRSPAQAGLRSRTRV